MRIVLMVMLQKTLQIGVHICYRNMRYVTIYCTTYYAATKYRNMNIKTEIVKTKFDF